MSANRFFVLALVVAALPIGGQAQAQNFVNLSLNLRYADPADPSEGGQWTLVAKTTSPNGIQAVNAVLKYVDGEGAMVFPGIGGISLASNPIVDGDVVELLYVQDTSSPSGVVVDVGRGAGTPGEIGLDPLHSPSWDNAAGIGAGTFGASRPEFAVNADSPPDVTDANVLSTPTAPFHFSAAAAVTITVRGDSLAALGLETTAGAGLLAGDVNRDFAIDGIDLAQWALGFGEGNTWDQGDVDDSESVDGSDFLLWQQNFGATALAPSDVGAETPHIIPALADTDGDGDTDGADVIVWSRGFGVSSGAPRSQGDFNGDGAVNASDFAIWRFEYGSAEATPGRAVPEPSGWFGASVAMIALAGWRRTRPE